MRRIDEIFAIEREINGVAAEQRLAVRDERIRPLIGELEGWMRTERARLSRHADIAKAMDYITCSSAGPPSPFEQIKAARAAGYPRV